MSARSGTPQRDAPREPDDASLRALVRDALAADEPADVPAFAAVYAAARRRVAATGAEAGVARPPAARRYAPAAAIASVAAVSIAVLLARPWQGAPDTHGGLAHDTATSAPADRAEAPVAPDAALVARDPDYAAVVALRRSMRAGTPLDAALASLPRTVARGLPVLPEYRYPLLPEGSPLGAPPPSRNPS